MSIEHKNLRDLGKDYEKDIEHDLLFEINVPEDEATVMVRLDFDLEMQRKYRPGYKVPKRGIYYCSRMISGQITDKDFEDAKNNSDYVDYDKLRHIYSVWICLNEVPQGLQNSVDSQRGLF